MSSAGAPQPACAALRRGGADDEVVRFAREVGPDGPVAAVGARTRWTLGGTPTPGTRLVPVPGGVVEHRAEEMTVRVRAGTPVAELHSELAASGQRTSLPERGGTVGGALAVGESHLCALGRGPVRDAVLQVRYVSADGRVVTGGGPTVKNVSGYDLPRLLVGSLGTLGLIAEVVLRTQPVPAAGCWFRAEGADPWAARDLLYRPAAILWDGGSVWARLEGDPADVSDSRSALDRVGTWEEVAGPPVLPPQRWSLRPRELRQGPVAGYGPNWVAEIGVGTVHASSMQPPRRVQAAVVELHRRLKEGFDPTGRLAPGRSVLGAVLVDAPSASVSGAGSGAVPTGTGGVEAAGSAG
ncbi:MAG: FAD-binding protein [Actinomycetota bacterium]|nr:FAD-binding protein [Actinomycetota bacterium]